MLEIVERIIHGEQCPKCGNERLYTLKDKRFKCSVCLYKYSSSHIEKDLKLLHYFSLEIPANKAVKDLGCTRETKRCEDWLPAAHSGNVKDIYRPKCCTNALTDLMLRCHDVFTESKLFWFLDFGTMLGVYRENKIIAHDTDVDITCKLSDWKKIYILKDKFEEGGFYLEVAKRKALFRLCFSKTNKQHVDIWTYRDEKSDQHWMEYVHGYLAGGRGGGHNIVIRNDQLKEIGTVAAYGREWPMIEDPLATIKGRYGESDWKNPDNHTNGCKRGW